MNAHIHRSASGQRHPLRSPTEARLLVAAALLIAAALLLVLPAAGRAQDITDAVARELTVLNDLRASQATPTTDTVAREATVFNDLRAVLGAPASDAITREATVFNDLRSLIAFASVDAVAREFTVGLVTDNMSDVRTLLRFVAGLAAATNADRTRFDIVAGTSAGKLDILDAIRLARRTVGLDP